VIIHPMYRTYCDITGTERRAMFRLPRCT